MREGVYHLQLSLSNALQIPLGSKFLTDLSTLNSSACTLECSTTPSSLSFSFFSISFSSLAIFFSIPQAAENSPVFHFYPPLPSFSLLDWPLETLIWPVCHSLFIPYPSSSIRSSAKLVFSFMCVTVCRNKLTYSLNSCQLHDALKIFLISSHSPFHIFTFHFIFCLSHAFVVWMRKKLN